MATTADLYGVLGVNREASVEDIKKAYRRLAREHHPDVNGDPEAEDRFKEVSAAYEILSDPGKRAQYDAFGSAGGPGTGPNGPFGDVSDIFDFFFSGGAGAGSPFGGRGRTRRRPGRTQPGEALGASIRLTFMDAAFGVERDVSVEANQACADCTASGSTPGTGSTACAACGGAGEVRGTQQSIFGTVMTTRPCGACGGSGEVVTDPCLSCAGEGRSLAVRVVSVEIPAGVADGMELRVPGAGHAGRAGGIAGDLYLSLQVAPHEIFRRHGQDLSATLELSVAQAAFGTDVEIETIDGPEVVKISKGQQSGEVIRLRGRGLPHIERRGRGDLYLTVHVRTPDDLTREQRKLLEQLAAARGEDLQKGAKASLQSPPGRG